MVDAYGRWPARGYVPTCVGHDARKLMVLARRRLSPELETALADPGTLVGAGGGAQAIANSPDAAMHQEAQAFKS